MHPRAMTAGRALVGRWTQVAIMGALLLLASACSGGAAPLIGVAVPSDGQVTVSWQPPPGDAGVEVVGYVVVPYIGAEAQTAVPFGSTATTQTITGLANGTTYTFVVYGVDALGRDTATSAPSNEAAPYQSG